MATALGDFTPANTALVLVDLQNDFIHPDGAYGRAGKSAPFIIPLSYRLSPLTNSMRARFGFFVSPQFSLLPF